MEQCKHYEPPRVLHLTGGQRALGDCNPGSSDVLDCSTGNDAGRDCMYPGGTAADECLNVGGSAVGVCFNAGSSAGTCDTGAAD